MNADGTDVHLVAADGGGFGTSWSGDGSKIAYVAPNPTDHSPDIWTVNAAGINPTEVISGGQARYPSLSGDGTQIVWDRTGAGQLGLMIPRAVGSNRIPLKADSSGIA